MKKPNARLEVLRKTAKFLYCVAEGAPTTRDEFKTFSNLCFLAIPPSQRLTKAEVAEIKAHPWERPAIVDFKSLAAGERDGD